MISIRFNLAILVAATLLTPVQPMAKETTAPDVLFIMGDDVGNYLSCYGDPNIKTPNLDRIAREGVRFDNAWVTQASCSPSRSSILTGLYPHQNGQVGLAHLGFSMSGDFDSIPKLLNDAGYYTGVVGKVHVKPESSLPFQYMEQLHGLQGRDMDNFTSHVKEMLSKAGDKPVFLNASFYDPHRPFLKDVGGDPKTPLEAKDVQLLPFMKGLEDVPELRPETAGYYTNILRLDVGVGKVLDAMEEAGRLDNTLIIFIGDHGAPFGRSKVTCYNPGMHIPFIVKWPGVSTPGTVSKSLVSTIDILPTILDAAGVKYDGKLPGVSIKPAVADPTKDVRQYMFGEFTAHLPEDYYPRFTVRNKRFQLIYNLMSDVPNPTPGIEGEVERNAVFKKDLGTSRAQAAVREYMHPPEYELFDLENDPDNFVNLAEDPKYADIKQELIAQLAPWRKATNDPLLKPGELKRLGKEIKDRKIKRKAGKNRGKGKKGNKSEKSEE